MTDKGIKMYPPVERLPNGLTMRQDDRYFKLGQDSVLLSSFAAPRKKDRVLDLGCGTGAISLMLYRPGLRITGLELQKGALEIFRQSIKDNGIEINTLQGDLREIRTILGHGSMDYVVCNPPYFAQASGKASGSEEKRLARQDGTCTVGEIADAAAYVLSPGGRAAFVFRPERLGVLFDALSKKRLAVKRLRFVHQDCGAPPSAVLAECRRDGSLEGLRVEPPLFVKSKEYENIYLGNNGGE